MGSYTVPRSYYMPDLDEDYLLKVNAETIQRINDDVADLYANKVSLFAADAGTAQTGHIRISGNIHASNVYGAALTFTGAGTINSLAATTFLSAGTTITAAGDINSTAGNVGAAGNVTAGSYVNATTYVHAGSYLSAGSYLTAGTYLTVGSFADLTGPVGIGVIHDATKAALYVSEATGKALRIAHDATHWGDFQIDASGVLSVIPSGSATILTGSVAATTHIDAGSYLTTVTYANVGTYLGVGVDNSSGTNAQVYILAPTAPAQLRLARASNRYLDVVVDSLGQATITPSGNGTAGTQLLFFGTGTAIRSNPFTSGVNGWNIDTAGNVEFWNATIRGALTAMVFKIGEMLALGGTVVLSQNSSQFNADFVTPTTIGGTVASVQVKKSSTGASVISNGDILWAQYWDGTGIRAFYFVVSAKDDTPTGYSTCTLTLKSKDGTTSGTVAAVTVRKDVPFTNIGSSTTGGTYMSLSADGTKGGAGNITVITHDGSPWLGGTHEKSPWRAGNLRNTGIYGATDTFGMIAGDDIGLAATSFKGFAVDGTNGLRLFNTAISEYLSGTQTVSITAGGELKIGTNVGAAANTVFLVTPAGGAWGTETLLPGAVLIGPNTGGNVLWDAAVANPSLHIRTVTTSVTSFYSAADIHGYYGIFRRPMDIASATPGGFGSFTAFNTGATFTNPAGTSGTATQGGRIISGGSSGFTVELWANGGKIIHLDYSGLNFTIYNSAGNIKFWADDMTTQIGYVGTTYAAGSAALLNTTVASITPRAIYQVDTVSSGSDHLLFQLQAGTTATDTWGYLYGSNASSGKTLSIGKQTAPLYMLDVTGSVGVNTSGTGGFQFILGSTAALNIRMAVNEISSYSASSASPLYLNATSTGAVIIQNVLQVATANNAYVYMHNGSNVGAPTTTTRSIGTKIVYWDSLSGSAVDFAVGIGTNTLWWSVPSTVQQFAWYAGTTLYAQLNSTSLILLSGRGFQFNNNANSASFAWHYENTNNRAELLFGGSQVAYISSAGGYVQTSDAALKTDFTRFDALAMIAHMGSIQQWRWRWDESEGWHVGPTAQQMHGLGFGDNPTKLNPANVGGLALAGVQQLIPALAHTDYRVTQLEREVAALKRRLGEN